MGSIYSYTEKKRIRKDFGKHPSTIETPPLLELQLESYYKFLQAGVEPDKLSPHGLEIKDSGKVARAISDFNTSVHTLNPTLDPNTIYVPISNPHKLEVLGITDIARSAMNHAQTLFHFGLPSGPEDAANVAAAGIFSPSQNLASIVPMGWMGLLLLPFIRLRRPSRKQHWLARAA